MMESLKIDPAAFFQERKSPAKNNDILSNMWS